VPTDERRLNHLAGQVSPYLSAHARDPVDWRPWSSDVFEEAAASDRPIFLSIGYQSCHWCHVMQRESFRDEDTAARLNRDFVCVKVDREVRPDVDAFYMAYVQASTGSGGWPMSVFLTPDLEPFFGGTYFPKGSPSPRIPSFADVLDVVSRSWREERNHTLEVAADALAFVQQQQSPTGTAPWDRAFVGRAAEAVLALHDEEHGGFGRAPKFPMAPVVSFLLAYHETAHHEEALRAAIRSVLAMLHGGVWDQVGGGLFRYATDDEWLVPHFEKMLYDQGLLLANLAELFDVTQADEFAIAAESTADFLEDRLAREDGGYWSSIDAETAGVEGDTYVWRWSDLTSVLEPEEVRLVERHLGASEAGNWEHRSNVLTRRLGRAEDAAAVDAVLARLRRARDERPQPAVIRNAIVSWNALTARGLIEAGAAIGSERLTDMGLATLDWLLATAVGDDAVAHAIGDPAVEEVRLLDDHAALTAAALAGATCANRDDLVAIADRIHHGAVERFSLRTGDAAPAGLAMTDAEELPFAPLELSDSPTPAGISLLAENETKLAGLLGREPADSVIDAMQRQMGDAARIGPHLTGHALAVSARRPVACGPV
jgi:uncharacterized protein YyaL (SSP411 family)